MRNLSLFFVLLIVFSNAGCKKKHLKNTAPISARKDAVELTEQQLKFIKTDTVHMAPAAEQFTAVGVVSFAEDNVVRIFPIVSGIVEKVEVSLGEYVKKGQKLATLLSGDISQYQRDYNVAKSFLEVNEKNYNRAKELYEAGMKSEKDLAEAKNQYVNAQSQFDESKQILALYGGSNNQDGFYHVTAPRDGYIVERNVNTGTQIRTDNSNHLFTISDLKTVWIWSNVRESDISKIREGDDVLVRTIAYPDLTFEGEISKISKVLDPASRVVRVLTVLDNTKGILKPEMFATVLITPLTSEKVMVVPNTSIILENNQYYVMVQSGKAEFKKVQIQTGRVFHFVSEVKEGLQVGDRVVTEGSLFVLTAFNQL